MITFNKTGIFYKNILKTKLIVDQNMAIDVMEFKC